MTTWQYRVIVQKEAGADLYGIHEVYLDEAGRVVAFTEADVLGDSVEDLRIVLAQMGAALQVPPLLRAEIEASFREGESAEDSPLIPPRPAVAQYILNNLYSFDQMVNTLLGGDPDETISSRLGKMMIRREANVFAKLICWFLDIIDPGHCVDSIESDEGKRQVI